MHAGLRMGQVCTYMYMSGYRLCIRISATIGTQLADKDALSRAANGATAQQLENDARAQCVPFGSAGALVYKRNAATDEAGGENWAAADAPNKRPESRGSALAPRREDGGCRSPAAATRRCAMSTSSGALRIVDNTS
jgi:hypothetical protein